MGIGREHWSSKLGFIFAAIGSAIGIGVLWKVPYAIGERGGGLFLCTYILLVVVLGIPLLIGEIAIGRSSQKGSIPAFNVLSHGASFWKSIGWVGVIASGLIMSFYSVISGWGMSYALSSISGAFLGKSSEDISIIFCSLSNSGSITTLWHFLFTMATAGIIFTGVKNGIERWAGIMTKSLCVILVALVLYNTTLPGFKEAFRFIFYPDFKEFDLSSALEALGLAFFTLSIGQGVMVSYGSYLGKSGGVPMMAGVIGISVILAALLSAFVVFPVVFSFGFEPQQGPGLIFKTLPYLFSRLPGGMIISTVFFILFIFTALTSSIAIFEVLVSNMMDLLKLSRGKASIYTSLGTFVLGIPSALSFSGGLFPKWKEIYGTHFLGTVDYMSSVWLIPISGLFVSLFIGWKMDHDKLLGELEWSKKLYNIWVFSMKWMVPATIVVLILKKGCG